MTSLALYYALLGGASTLALSKLHTRLQLSKAKHPSLRGHSRWRSRFARLVPFYEYDEEEFFRSDGAPEAVAGVRRARLRASGELYRRAIFRIRPRPPRRSKAGLSDLQFTAAYRVPFQYRRLVRKHLKAGSFMQARRGSRSPTWTGTSFSTWRAPTA